MNSAPDPAANGLPATGVNDPELLIANAETEAEPEFATKTNAIVLACVVMLFIPPPPHPQRRHNISAPNKFHVRGASSDHEGSQDTSREERGRIAVIAPQEYSSVHYR